MADPAFSVPRLWLLAPPPGGGATPSAEPVLLRLSPPLRAAGLPPTHPRSGPGDISNRPGPFPALSKPSMAPHDPENPVLLGRGLQPLPPSPLHLCAPHLHPCCHSPPPHVPLLAFTKPHHPSGPALQDTLLYTHTHMHTHSHKLTQTRRVRNVCTHLHAPRTSHSCIHALTRCAQGPISHVYTRNHIHAYSHTPPPIHTLTYVPSQMPTEACCARSRHISQADPHTHVHSVHTCINTHVHTPTRTLHKPLTQTHPFDTLTRAAAHAYPYSHIHTPHLHVKSPANNHTHSHVLSYTHTQPHTGSTSRHTPTRTCSHTRVLHTCTTAHSPAYLCPHHHQGLRLSLRLCLTDEQQVATGWREW